MFSGWGVEIYLKVRGRGLGQKKILKNLNVFITIRQNIKENFYKGLNYTITYLFIYLCANNESTISINPWFHVFWLIIPKLAVAYGLTTQPVGTLMTCIYHGFRGHMHDCSVYNIQE